jgi:hypothetical protein
VSRMGVSKRAMTALLLTVIVAVGSGAAIMFIATPNTLSVSFSPKDINTLPGGTGWFLAEVESVQQITEYDVDIQTNVSVDFDYVLWPQTSLLEIFLYPSAEEIHSVIEVDLTISTGASIAKDSAYLHVLNWTAGNTSEVLEKLDAFVDYLSVSQQEFGINESTQWTPICNSAGILVVGHYLFKSDGWELELDWHVMIQPYDWVRIYLRHRADAEPCWAGEISSWSLNASSVVEIEPPQQIYRPMGGGM